MEDRIRRLLEAGIAINSELALDAVLRKLVETAAELTGARYAALGVIRTGGNGLERFLTHGIDQATYDAIGETPRGRGVLGVLIREARPLRIDDLAEDPRSVGFPPHHPEMHTFLGVPIVLRGVAYGTFYLTEKQDGSDFTEEDQDVIELLAQQAAVAVENARLYESATRWSRQLEYLADVGNAIAGELELPHLLELVATRLRELLGAKHVTIALPLPDGGLRIEASSGAQAGKLVGMRLSPDSKSARVLERRRSERVDALIDDPEVEHTIARAIGGVSGLFVPLVARERPIGMIACHDREGSDPRFTDDDLRLAEAFAARAAVAADISTRIARDALRRVVAAEELERRRLARELHDETGQALTSILLGLRSVEEARTPEATRTAARELRELVVATLQDVRRLAVELRPKALDDFGLVAALQRLTSGFAEQTGLDVDLEARLPGERLPSEIETALYRIVQEALTNVVKHARAEHVSVLLTRKNHSVTAVIEDDGQGFSVEDAREDGLGLIGMQERVGLLDGRVTIETAPGAGTTLVVEVPLP